MKPLSAAPLPSSKHVGAISVAPSYPSVGALSVDSHHILEGLTGDPPPTTLLALLPTVQYLPIHLPILHVDPCHALSTKVGALALA